MTDPFDPTTHTPPPAGGPPTVPPDGRAHHPAVHPAPPPTVPPDGWAPAWAVPAAAPLSPSVVAPTPGSPAAAPPMAADPRMLYPGAAAAALPLEAVVPTPSRRRSRGPSFYAVAFSLSALLCAAGVGFAAGRLTDDGSSSGGGQGFPNGAPVALAASGGSSERSTQSGTAGTTDATSVAAPTVTLAPVAGGTSGDGTSGDGTSGDDATGADASGADADGGGPPDGGGFPGGGMPGGGGFGIEGTVTAIDDGTITVETESGRTQEVVVDTATAYHQETPADAADLSVGATVRITTSGGSPGRPGGDAGSGTDASSGLTATDVLLLEP